MKNKEMFLKKLSEAIDKIEDKDAEFDYFSMSFQNYNPDNKNNERKIAYFSLDLNYDFKKEEFELNDRSEPFTCTMHYTECEKRGWCNGDC